jgi:hypothetical protein
MFVLVQNEWHIPLVSDVSVNTLDALDSCIDCCVSECALRSGTLGPLRGGIVCDEAGCDGVIGQQQDSDGVRPERLAFPARHRTAAPDSFA